MYNYGNKEDGYSRRWGAGDHVCGAYKDEEHKLGTIYTEVTESTGIWLNTTIREECIKCKLLPVCFGGCREFINNLDSNGAPCRKVKYHLEESMYQINQHYR